MDRSKFMDIFSIYIPSFFIFLGMGIVSPVLAIYARSFGVSLFMAGMAITVVSLGRLVMDFPSGMLAERYGRKPVMVLGTLLLTICAFLNAWTDNFWLFLLFRFFQGAGSSMWMTSRSTLLADVLKPEERGRVLGYFQSFTVIGQAAGPTIGGFIATWWGIRSNFYFYAFICAISLILTWFFIREPDASVRHGGHRMPLDITLKLMRNKGFFYATVAAFTGFMMMSGIRQTTLPLYAATVAGLDPASIGVMMSCATVVSLFLTIPMGYGIDLIGRKPIVVASLVINAVACFLFPSYTDFWMLCAVSLVLGLGSGGMQAPLAMAADCTVGMPRGIAMGVFNFFGDIGALLGPVLLGAIADAAGLRLPFYVMGGIVMLSAAAIQLWGVETLSTKKPATVDGAPPGAGGGS